MSWVGILYVIINHKYILLARNCRHTIITHSIQVHILWFYQYNMALNDEFSISALKFIIIFGKCNDRSMNLHLRYTHLFFGRQKFWHRQFIHTDICVVASVNEIICNMLWISDCEIVLILLCNIFYNLWRFFIA